MGRRLEPQKSVGYAVRSRRHAAGLTQRELADSADVNVTWLSHLERGRANPAWGTLSRLADALGISMVDLAREVEGIEQGTVKVPPAGRIDRL